MKVLSDGVTAEETTILHENVLGGTAERSAIDCPTAAKTGTTTELVDAWLDGYTPEYATVVWMGYPKERVPMTDVHGEAQQGGALPAVIWHDYMAAVTEGKPCVEFPQPTEPLVYRPFFGKYETMDQSGAPATGLETSLGARRRQRCRAARSPQIPPRQRNRRAWRGSRSAGARTQVVGRQEETPAEPAAPNKAQAEPGAGGGRAADQPRHAQRRWRLGRRHRAVAPRRRDDPDQR